jgi:hypothetical protein
MVKLLALIVEKQKLQMLLLMVEELKKLPPYLESI